MQAIAAINYVQTGAHKILRVV